MTHRLFSLTIIIFLALFSSNVCFAACTEKTTQGECISWIPKPEPPRDRDSTIPPSPPKKNFPKKNFNCSAKPIHLKNYCQKFNSFYNNPNGPFLYNTEGIGSVGSVAIKACRNGHENYGILGLQAAIDGYTQLKKMYTKNTNKYNNLSKKLYIEIDKCKTQNRQIKPRKPAWMEEVDTLITSARNSENPDSIRKFTQKAHKKIKSNYRINEIKKLYIKVHHLEKKQNANKIEPPFTPEKISERAIALQEVKKSLNSIVKELGQGLFNNKKNWNLQLDGSEKITTASCLYKINKYDLSEIRSRYTLIKGQVNEIPSNYTNRKRSASNSIKRIENQLSKIESCTVLKTMENSFTDIKNYINDSKNIKNPIIKNNIEKMVSRTKNTNIENILNQKYYKEKNKISIHFREYQNNLTTNINLLSSLMLTEKNPAEVSKNYKEAIPVKSEIDKKINYLKKSFCLFNEQLNKQLDIEINNTYNKATFTHEDSFTNVTHKHILQKTGAVNPVNHCHDAVSQKINEC